MAVEDSTNGIRSASAAGMRVVAVPNGRTFRHRIAALRRADGVLGSLAELLPALQRSV